MPDPAASDQTTGFSDEEKSELRQMIAEAIGSATPPKVEPTKERPTVSDSDWDKMTDRQRESFVRDVVSDLLDGLARDDADRRRDDEIERLKAEKDKKPEPERPPGVVSRLQKLIWGDEPQKP